MLFLSERPAIRGAERASEAGERTWEAEALIKEARRRRRRRWIGGTLAVLIAAAGATTWILLDGTAVGPVQRRTVGGGPGPSIIDMPTAGCWQFTLRWSGHTDTVDLPYAAGSLPDSPKHLATSWRRSRGRVWPAGRPVLQPR